MRPLAAPTIPFRVEPAPHGDDIFAAIESNVPWLRIDGRRSGAVDLLILQLSDLKAASPCIGPVWLS